MKKGISILAIWVLGFASCISKKSNVILSKSEGLEGKNLNLSELLINNKDTGIIAGSQLEVESNPDRASDTFAFVKREAALYRTIDGGNTWQRKSFGSGCITMVKCNKHLLLAVKMNEDRMSEMVYSSNDFGDTWKQEEAFPHRISKLLFADSLFVVVTSDSKVDSASIFLSSDNGRNWRVLNADLPVYEAVTCRNKLIYLSKENSSGFKKLLLVLIDLENEKSKVVELPNDFKFYSMTSYHDSVRLVGIQSNAIVAYSLTEKNQLNLRFRYIDDSSIFPQGYYNNDVQEWIVAGKRNGVGVENSILTKTNQGKVWERVEYKINNYIKPFAWFETGDTVAWFYAGNGRFQILRK